MSSFIDRGYHLPPFKANERYFGFRNCRRSRYHCAAALRSRNVPLAPHQLMRTSPQEDDTLAI